MIEEVKIEEADGKSQVEPAIKNDEVVPPLIEEPE